MPEKRKEYFRLLLDHLAWIEHQFLSGIRKPWKAGNLRGMMRYVGGVRKSIHQSWLSKGLGLLCRSFKGVQEEIPSEEAITFPIGSVAYPAGQCISPQVHPCQRLFDQDGYFHPPYRPDLAPCDEGYSHAYTRGLPCGLPEVVGTVQQVYCSQRRLLRRGQEIHVCTINKSAYKTKVLKLI